MPTDKPTGRRPTGSQRPPTGGHQRQTGRLAAAPRAKKNPLPLILAGGGGLVLVIILIVLASGGGGGTAKKEEEPPVEQAATPKPKPPDVSHLETDGRKKCDEGAKACGAKVPQLAGAKDADKEKLRGEIAQAIKTIDEGLAKFKEATKIAGKPYDLVAWERERAKAVKKWTEDLEAEARASCEEGLKLIQGTEAMMTGGPLGDDQKKQLLEELEKGKKRIEHGNNLYEQINVLTGERFDDTVKYGRALKAAKMKILELRPK